MKGTVIGMVRITVGVCSAIDKTYPNGTNRMDGIFSSGYAVEKRGYGQRVANLSCFFLYRSIGCSVIEMDVKKINSRKLHLGKKLLQ